MCPEGSEDQAKSGDYLVSEDWEKDPLWDFVRYPKQTKRASLNYCLLHG